MAVFRSRILQCLLLQLVTVCILVEIKATIPHSCEEEIASGSASGAVSLNDSRCIPLNDEGNRNLLLPMCLDYLPANKCSIYRYTDDAAFIEIAEGLALLDATGLETDASEFCVDTVRAYVCNYVYPGCNSMTGQPQGICQDECIRFAGPGSLCREFVDLLISLAASTRIFTFEVMCNFTLRFLEVEGFRDEFVYNPLDCWNISSVIVTPLPVSMTNPPTALIASVTSVAVIAMLSTIVIVVSIVCLYRRRARARQKRIWHRSPSGTRPQHHLSNDYLIDFHLEELSQIPNDHDYEGITNFTLNAEDMETIGVHLKSVLLPFEQLEITGDLGEGAFGHVYKGVLTRISNCDCREEILPVAVKTIKNYSSYSDMKGFLMESALMSTFDHPHVLGLVGICVDSEKRSPYLVLPFMKNGDLKNYLKDQRSNDTTLSFPKGLDYGILVKICHHIASGMEYLASRKFVHRDLAARNCMVDSELCVRVADFGLTRDIYQTDYYRQRQSGRVPIKWMSPESLHDRISNEKTDVWSFGITCWEVFSLGRAPYPTISNHEMEEYLEQGFRLKMPMLCSQEMYDLMLLCWSNNASERPTFSKIVQMICTLLPSNATAKASPPSLHLKSSIYDLPPDFHSRDEDCPLYDLPPDSNNLGSESLLNSIISQLQGRSGVCLLEDESSDHPESEAKDDYTEMQPLGEDKLEPLVIENCDAVPPGDRERLYVNVLSEYSDQYVDVDSKHSHQCDITSDDTTSSLPGSCPSFSSSITSATSMHTTTTAKLE